MPKVIIRPTIPQDLPAAVAEPLPYRIKTLTVVLQDGDVETVLGLGGLGFTPHGVVAFVQIAPGVDPKHYAVSCHRAGLMSLQMFRDSGVKQIKATTDADNPAAIRWLSRLGFTQDQVQPLPEHIFWTLMNRD